MLETTDRRYISSAKSGRGAINVQYPGVRATMLGTGHFDATTARRHQDLVIKMFGAAMAPLRQPAPFDFGTSTELEVLRDRGRVLGGERDLNHVPPSDTPFLHCKTGGNYLLAAKLLARVTSRPMVKRYR